MANRMHTVFCICVAFLFSTVTGITLTPTPSIINVGLVGSTSELQLVCRPTATTGVFQIAIGKTPTVGEITQESRIVSVTGDGGVVTDDTSYTPRFVTLPTGTVSGSPNLQMRIKDLMCTDAASYYCQVLATSGPEETFVNVTARSYPGDIRMTVGVNSENPQDSENMPNRQYRQGDRLQLRCNGNVGNQQINNANPSLLWKWETRIENTGSVWQPFNSNNITYEDFRPVGSPGTSGVVCHYSGATTLVYYVGILDNTRQFRCSASSSQYNASMTINVEGAPTDPGNPSNPGGVTQAGPPIGAIVGGIIGGLVFIVIVVVLVWFFVIRRKDGGQDYDTGEGKGDNQMTDNVAYATPGSRDLKPRKGHENEALDEPHEKPPPKSYYANDYDHGRANPGMDDYDDDRNYDDDDGTDRRGHGGPRGYGSAV